MTTSTAIAVARVGWLVIGLSFIAWECYWLGKGIPEATFSYQIFTIRFNPIGRFVILPVGCWLVLHLMMAPHWLVVSPDWRSLVALSVGIAWASWETWSKQTLGAVIFALLKTAWRAWVKR